MFYLLYIDSNIFVKFVSVTYRMSACYVPFVIVDKKIVNSLTRSFSKQDRTSASVCELCTLVEKTLRRQSVEYVVSFPWTGEKVCTGNIKWFT